MVEVRKRRKRRKKKSYKKALWITLTTLVIVGGGWAGLHYATHRDVQVADVGVEEGFFDFSEFTDNSSSGGINIGGGTPNDGQESDDTYLSDDMDGVKDGTPTMETVKTSSSDSELIKPGVEEDKSGLTDADSEESKGSSGGTDETVSPKQAIENKYASVLQQLQNAALSKLDTLATNALSDYSDGRSLADISTTYLSAANKLQGAVDNAFDTQVSRMRVELKDAGFSTEAADQAEEQYAAAIAAKKSEMLSQVGLITGK